jgi:hypothetical protein
MFEESDLYAGPSLSLDDYVTGKGLSDVKLAPAQPVGRRGIPGWLLLIPGLLIGGGFTYVATDPNGPLPLFPIEAAVAAEAPAIPAAPKPKAHHGHAKASHRHERSHG